MTHGPRHAGFHEMEGKEEVGQTDPRVAPTILPPGVHPLYHPLPRVWVGGAVKCCKQWNMAKLVGHPSHSYDMVRPVLLARSLLVGDLSDQLGDALWQGPMGDL